MARVRAAKVVTYCSIECARQSDTGAVAAPQASASPTVSAPATKPSPPAPATKPRSAATAPKGKGRDAPTKPAPKARQGAPEALATERSEALASSRPAQSPEPGSSSQESRTREATLPGTSLTSSKRRTTILVASAAIMLGGVGILILPELLADRAGQGAASPADAPPASAKSAEQEGSNTRPGADQGEPETSLPSAAVLRSAAIRELESHLQDESRRFQRLAGIALARIQHEGAVARLAELLSSEPSDLSRIDIAYGMALGGDPKGREYLVGELKSSRRDARIDAARRLVQLGDDAGRKTLVQMLSVRSHRLGAAAELAMLGDEEGLAVLRQELAEKDTTDENRMRAAVGLGRAGDQSARELLLTILQEGRFVVDAAGALAALGEVKAVPALERQLELTAMRVGAAESLQSMGVEVDLAATASALTHANEEGRIAAAEAIIILTRAEGG